MENFRKPYCEYTTRQSKYPKKPLFFLTSLSFLDIVLISTLVPCERVAGFQIFVIRRTTMKERVTSISEIVRAAVKQRLIELLKDWDYLSLRTPQVPTFQVTLFSFWPHDGEKDVIIKEKKPLDQVIAAAIQEFKKVNKRSDVQARWIVSVLLPSGLAVPIPEEHWKQFKPATPRREQTTASF